METKQPIWKFVANLGDVNWIDYGGYFIYTDETAVYDAEGELLIAEESEGDVSSWTVYRFCLEQLADVNGVLVNKRLADTYAAGEKLPYPIEEYNEWFADDLSGVADFIGTKTEVLRASFCSDRPIERAFAYKAIGDYHGFENLDGYPLRFYNRAEIEDRYSERNKL